MSQSLIDQPQRADLIAELYDRYAAGLFAYCADQLGDLGSATDVLVSVLTSVSASAPPRAALYAFARREIHRRDVVYSPPAVDPLIDPASALVERSLRELRPHQREVLMLCAVCGLSKAELAWVLDVAPDTAQELAVGAGHRFRQLLGTALSTTRVRVPKSVADIYGALGIAPLRDVLGRLPWPQPPAALRVQVAGSRTVAPAPLFVKPRWPSPPVWPQPLADADPATSTVIFPAELMSPPSDARVAEHEATTAPMPKYRDSLDSARPARNALGPSVPLGDLLDSPDPLRDLPNPLGLSAPLRDPLSTASAVPLRDPLGDSRPRKDPLSAPTPFDEQRESGLPPEERPFFLAEPDPNGAEPFATGDVILPKGAPDPYMTGDVLVYGDLTALPPPPPRPSRPERPRDHDRRIAPPEQTSWAFQPHTPAARPDTPVFRPETYPDRAFDAFDGRSREAFGEPARGAYGTDPRDGYARESFGPGRDAFGGPGRESFGPGRDAFGGPGREPFNRPDHEQPYAESPAPLFTPRPKPGRPARPARPAKPSEPVYRLPDPRTAGPGEAPRRERPGVRPDKLVSGRANVRPDKLVSGRPTDLPDRRRTDLPDRRPTDLPAPRGGKPARDRPGRQSWELADDSDSSFLAPRPVRARPVPKRRPEVPPRPQKVRRRKDRHYDWVWELVGFLICVAIAMIVFFSLRSW